MVGVVGVVRVVVGVDPVTVTSPVTVDDGAVCVTVLPSTVVVVWVTPTDTGGVVFELLPESSRETTPAMSTPRMTTQKATAAMAQPFEPEPDARARAGARIRAGARVRPLVPEPASGPDGRSGDGSGGVPGGGGGTCSDMVDLSCGRGGGSRNPRRVPPRPHHPVRAMPMRARRT